MDEQVRQRDEDESRMQDEGGTAKKDLGLA